MSDVRNAFTVNVLGLERHPFPFVIEPAISPTGSHRLYVCPLAVADIAEVLIARAQPHLLVFDVEHTTFKPEELAAPGPITCAALAELADDAHVDHVAYGPDVIVIPATSLAALLNGLYHYEIKIVDLPRTPSPDEAAELYCHFAESTHDPRLGTAALPLASRFFLHSHDDCYTALEADDRQWVLRIVEKSLRLYAATVIATTTNTPLPDIATLPPAVVETFMTVPATTILRHYVHWDGDLLRIGFSRHRFDFRQPVDHALDGNLSYVMSDRQWRVEST